LNMDLRDAANAMASINPRNFNVVRSMAQPSPCLIAACQILSIIYTKSPKV
jgi:hypothetical protein